MGNYLTIIRRRRVEYRWIKTETKARFLFTNIHNYISDYLKNMHFLLKQSISLSVAGQRIQPTHIAPAACNAASAGYFVWQLDKNGFPPFWKKKTLRWLSRNNSLNGNQSAQIIFKNHLFNDINLKLYSLRRWNFGRVCSVFGMNGMVFGLRCADEAAFVFALKLFIFFSSFPSSFGTRVQLFNSLHKWA